MSNRTPAALAMAGGLLLVLAHARGGSVLLGLASAGPRALPAGWSPDMVQGLGVLMFLAALGGAAVMAGGAFYARSNARSAGAMVLAGSAMGLLGLVVLSVAALTTGQGRAMESWLSGISGLGVILGMGARHLAQTRG